MWQERTPLVTLANGDILMAVEQPAVEESVDADTDDVSPAVPAQADLRRYDANGDFISSITFDAAASSINDEESHFGLAAVGDGFALIHSISEEAEGEDSTHEYSVQLDIYDATNTITASQTWAGLGLGSEPAMSVNADGNINILLEVVSALQTDIDNNPNQETRAMCGPQRRTCC